ncbi:hypothetical protein HD554DRAFT_1443886 [Boletus coccyginus]|nr:hypothetical protein HD554DRAFT_1443886 [Boletus coccyginus]
MHVCFTIPRQAAFVRNAILDHIKAKIRTIIAHHGRHPVVDPPYWSASYIESGRKGMGPICCGAPPCVTSGNQAGRRSNWGVIFNELLICAALNKPGKRILSYLSTGSVLQSQNGHLLWIRDRRTNVREKRKRSKRAVHSGAIDDRRKRRTREMKARRTETYHDLPDSQHCWFRARGPGFTRVIGTRLVSSVVFHLHLLETIDLHWRVTSPVHTEWAVTYIVRPLGLDSIRVPA